MTAHAFFDADGNTLSGVFDMQTVFGTSTPAPSIPTGSTGNVWADILGRTVDTAGTIIRERDRAKLERQYLAQGLTPPPPGGSAAPASSLPSWVIPAALVGGLLFVLTRR